MPCSDAENRPVLHDLLKKVLRPGCRILEAGIGYGDIGSLVREIGKRKGLGFNDIDLVGVEIWEPYLQEKCLTKVYSQIILGDIREIFPQISDKYFDLVLLIDILEHFERNEGMEVLRQAERIGKMVVVCVPIIDYPQGPVHGNPHEVHKAQWKVSELEKLGYETVFAGKVVGVFVKNP